MSLHNVPVDNAAGRTGLANGYRYLASHAEILGMHSFIIVFIVAATAAELSISIYVCFPSLT